MAVTASDRARLESFVGPVEEDDMASMSDRLDRLGVIEAVALEVLQTRLNQYRMAPAEFAAQGDVRLVTKENVQFLRNAIDDLIVYLGTLSINTAAQALVTAASGGRAAKGTQSIDVTSNAPRQG